VKNKYKDFCIVHLQNSYMKFLTESELSEYYGKPFAKISPTDVPKTKFVCGVTDINCLECGATLVSECSGSEFVESAFCENCEIEFSRSRRPVSNEVSYQYHHHRVDEREEYVCQDCTEYHAITIADSDWEYTTEPEIHSYEEISLLCPCGCGISLPSLTLPFTFDCEKCTREYEFSLNP